MLLDAVQATLSVMGGESETIPARLRTEELWQEFHKTLHAFFRKRVGDEHAAEDLLQEAFLRIHKGIESVADDARIRGWNYRIARNLVIDHYRSRRPTEQLDQQLAPEVEPSRADAIAFGSCVQNMIEKLPGHYGDALRLVEIDGKSQLEAAELLGLSKSGAKSRVQRGRAMLKSLVSKCCEVEFDRHGQVLDHQCKSECC